VPELITGIYSQNTERGECEYSLIIIVKNQEGNSGEAGILNGMLEEALILKEKLCSVPHHCHLCGPNLLHMSRSGGKTRAR
jgi:hypothetical protein